MLKNQFLIPEGVKFRFLEIGLKASLDGGVKKAAAIQLIFSLAVWMSVMIVLGVLANFLSDPCSSGHGDCTFMIWCGVFPHVYNNSSCFSVLEFRKKQFLYSMVPSQKEEILEKPIWTPICGQILKIEEFKLCHGLAKCVRWI